MENIVIGEEVYLFSKDIKDVNSLRESFNDLSGDTFSIDFAAWYDKGYWTDKYMPYVLIKDGKVVANVSVSRIDFLINGITKDTGR